MGTLGQPKSNANANSEGHKYLNVANTIFISLLKVGSLMETQSYRQRNKILHKNVQTRHTHASARLTRKEITGPLAAL